MCGNPRCANRAESEHHTVAKWFTRSWEERDWALLYGELVPIKVPVCGDGTRGCHGLLTTNKANVEWDGKHFVWVAQGVREPLTCPLGGGVGTSPVSPPPPDTSSERDDSLVPASFEHPLDSSEEPKDGSLVGAIPASSETPSNKGESVDDSVVTDDLERECEVCSRRFETDLSNAAKARYCSTRCRQQAYRLRYPERGKGRKRAPEEPLKKKARNAVVTALRSGRLVRQPCEVCGAKWQESQAHHDDYEKPLNVRWLCRKHHEELHHPWDEQTAPRELVQSSPEIFPGKKCPTCLRKVPHPKKPSTPTSVTKAFRIPVDEAPAFTETLQACEEYVGTASQPFSPFKVMSLALGLVLQAPELKGFAEREAA